MIVSWPAASGASPGASQSKTIILKGACQSHDAHDHAIDAVNTKRNPSPSQDPLIINLAMIVLKPSREIPRSKIRRGRQPEEPLHEKSCRNKFVHQQLQAQDRASCQE